MDRDRAAETVRATLQRLGLAETSLGDPSATIRPVQPSAPEAAPPLPLLALGTDADLVTGATLGTGGMGIVRLATQRSLDRTVAVKTVLTAEDRAVRALVHEARTAGRLEHPNVVPVHALGHDGNGAPILVMKRVEGVTLRELIGNEGHAAWATVTAGHGDRLRARVEILAQVCRALAFAHDRGIVHRDLKPENVMVGKFGEVYLLDWGVALALATREHEPRGIAGTPGYMAPEMVHGDPTLIDARADVYLLGATLYEVLCGQMPHHSETPVGALAASLLGEIPPLYDAPPELADLATRAMSRDPTARPASADAFREALVHFLVARDADLIASSADASLQRAERAIASEGPASIEGYRLLIEARFGLATALRMRGDPDDATLARMDGCLALLAEREIALCSPSSARAIVADLRRPRPDLERRIAELEQALRRESDAAEAGKQARAAADTTMSRAPMLALVLFNFVYVYSALYVVSQLRPGIPGERAVVLAWSPLVLIYVAITYAFRRTLRASAASRHLGWFFVVWLFYPLALALTSVLAHEPWSETRSAVTSLVICTLGALTLVPEIWPSIVVAVVQLGTLLAWPRAFAVISVVTWLANSLVCVRALQKRAALSRAATGAG